MPHINRPPDYQESWEGHGHAFGPILHVHCHTHLCVLTRPFPIASGSCPRATRSGPVSVLRRTASRPFDGPPLVRRICRFGEIDGDCCSRRRGNRGNVSCCRRKAPEVRVGGRGSLVDPKRKKFQGTTRESVIRGVSVCKGCSKMTLDSYSPTVTASAMLG
jgi:hypothetical protein